MLVANSYQTIAAGHGISAASDIASVLDVVVKHTLHSLCVYSQKNSASLSLCQAVSPAISNILPTDLQMYIVGLIVHALCSPFLESLIIRTVQAV